MDFFLFVCLFVIPKDTAEEAVGVHRKRATDTDF